MSRLDVVLFGASGFTGQHAAEQLARIADQRKLSWAVAGRSRDKLLHVLKNISGKTGKDLSSTKVLIADVENEKSVQDMCEQARVLVNCCGPYTLYGEVVVKSAINSRTHYVDITGEPNFIDMMQLKYGQAARDAGVYVVSACAFESIPADLGVIFLQQNFGGVLNSVECYLCPEMHAQSVNTGTWYSLVNSLAHFSELPVIRKKMYPTALPRFTPKLKTRLFHRRLNGWCIPLPTSDSDIVYRTQRYFYERDGTRPAQFKNYVKIGSFFNTLATVLVSIFIYIMSQFKVTNNLLLKKPKIFSFGMISDAPSEDVIKNMGYEFVLCGKGWDESDASSIDKLPPKKSVIAKVSGVNPGYGMTVMGVLYSAVAILEEQHNMPPGGGVLTPGVAFSKTNLMKNLQDNEVSFQIVDSKVHQD